MDAALASSAAPERQAAASGGAQSPPPPSASNGASKRPARERKRRERSVLLHSMNVEERRQFLLDEAAERVEIVERMKRAAAGESANASIALDLSFDNIMNDKEIRSLAKQLKLSYGAIKQMKEPFQLVLCNASEALLESLKRFSADRWSVQWRHSDSSLPELLAPSELVYLSPDAPNALSELDPKKTYVIGGIVDKSRKKGATLAAATRAGVTTARLPIQEHITERLDHILNVNTVIEVLIAFQETGDWHQALTAALPQRKQTTVGRKARKRRELDVPEEESSAEAQIDSRTSNTPSVKDAVNTENLEQLLAEQLRVDITSAPVDRKA